MTSPRFTIIDIETTGGIAKRDKITEIAIIVYQDNKIIDRYESLINPERSIPHEITRITGITNEMVEKAPKFYEIAKEILSKTENSIFVAHNVFFDYNFIKEEFHQLGYSFSRKKLCTVQLSRRYFKGLRSYSLESLINHFKIEVINRHRAMDDTLATLDVFCRILSISNNLDSTINPIAGLLSDTKIPPSLNKKDIESLPELAGVYRMQNIQNESIYIGKSKNIKERIYQHFNDSSTKTLKMLHGIHKIDYTLTGSELMASLLEIEEIKKFQPEINRALRKKSHAFLMTARRPINKFPVFTVKESEWLDQQDEVVHHYPTKLAAKQHLDFIILTYQLCTKVNSQNAEGKACNGFQIGQCHGACVGKEELQDYFARFNSAYDAINRIFKQDFILITDGPGVDNFGVILVEEGFCRYTGFLDKNETYSNIALLKDALNPYIGNIESNRIIEQYLAKDKSIKKIIINENQDFKKQLYESL